MTKVKPIPRKQNWKCLVVGCSARGKYMMGYNDHMVVYHPTIEEIDKDIVDTLANIAVVAVVFLIIFLLLVIAPN